MYSPSIRGGANNSLTYKPSAGKGKADVTLTVLGVTVSGAVSYHQVPGKIFANAYCGKIRQI